MARKFFYISLAILSLTLAYHLGAARTEAQGTGTTWTGVGYGGSGHVYGVNAVGELWRMTTNGQDLIMIGSFAGGPVAAKPDSFGAIKGRFK